MTFPVLVCGEAAQGRLTSTTRELLGCAARLAGGEGNGPAVVLVGEGIEEAAREAVALGASAVFTVKGPSHGDAHPDLYAEIFRGACARVAPSVVLLGQTDMGRDVAPRLAARIGAGVTLDCLDVAVDRAGGALRIARPVYGGRAVAQWDARPGAPQVVTIRQRAQPAPEPDATRRGEAAPLDVVVDAAMVRGTLVETVREEAGGIKLEDAKVVVCGGGGIGGSDGFELLGELARLLGGAVGSSRVPVDEGWAPKTMEIGQTGRIVSPDLYVAVGISGAPQHLAGCTGARRIVAINRDPDAPIFAAADVGVVGDYRQVLPAFIERLKAIL